MAKFVIEKGIKIPAKTPDVGRPLLYPFADMQKGSSFVVPSGRATLRARQAASAYSRRHPEFKFTSRKTPNGVRIWRV